MSDLQEEPKVQGGAKVHGDVPGCATKGVALAAGTDPQIYPLFKRLGGPTSVWRCHSYGVSVVSKIMFSSESH
jgi:hypothetical protein